MPHQLIQTEDGSITLYVPELNEHYHSVHGAIQESIHIFIRAGLDFYLTSPEHRPPTEVPLSILEAGFGTGLNAYLSLLRSEELQLPLDYHSVEKYPLPPEEINRLHYPDQLPAADPGSSPCCTTPPGIAESRLPLYFIYTNTGQISGLYNFRPDSISSISMPSTRKCNPISGLRKYSAGSPKH